MIKSLSGAFLLVLFGCSSQNFQTIQTESSREAQAFYHSEVDILWVIDNSYDTMAWHQYRIAQHMEQFYRGLIKNKADFRVAATTMDLSHYGDGGDLLGSPPVVDNHTVNAVQALQGLLNRGGEGGNTEAGLEAMKRALENQVKLGEHSPFFRKDALLVVVFLTDDKDFSSGTEKSYVEYLNQLKGLNTQDRQRWIVNYIGITSLTDPNCTTYGNYVAKGERYINLAQYSSGVVDSICYTDFSSYIDQITRRLKSILNEYKLENKPILDSLTVHKNGVLIRQDSKEGWSFDPLRNSIFLNGSSKPGPQDNIEIKYEIAN